MKSIKNKFIITSLALMAQGVQAFDGDVFVSTKSVFNENENIGIQSIMQSHEASVLSPLVLASGLTITAVGLASALPVDLISLPSDLRDYKERLKNTKEESLEAISKLQMITAGLVDAEEAKRSMYFILNNVGKARLIQEISPLIKNSKEKIIQELKTQGKSEAEIQKMTAFLEKDPQNMNYNELMSYFELVQYALDKLEKRVIAQENMVSEQSFKNNVKNMSEIKSEDKH